MKVRDPKPFLVHIALQRNPANLLSRLEPCITLSRSSLRELIGCLPINIVRLAIPLVDPSPPEPLNAPYNAS